jgi:hypothetical protein
VYTRRAIKIIFLGRTFSIWEIETTFKVSTRLGVNGFQEKDEKFMLTRSVAVYAFSRITSAHEKYFSLNPPRGSCCHSIVYHSIRKRDLRKWILPVQDIFSFAYRNF